MEVLLLLFLLEVSRAFVFVKFQLFISDLSLPNQLTGNGRLRVKDDRTIYFMEFMFCCFVSL